MGENGVIELEVGRLKTKVNRFATRLEYSGFVAVMAELYHLSSFYEEEGKGLQVKKKAKELSSAERQEAFKALADLERTFTERSIPLYERIMATLSAQIVSGAPFTEYGLAELTKASGQFIAEQSLKKEESKNSDGGRDSSSETRPPSTAPSAKGGSLAETEKENAVKPNKK